MSETQSEDELREVATEVFAAGLAAVDPRQAIRRCLSRRGHLLSVQQPGGAQRTLDLDAFSRILVVGAGKATAAMCEAAEDVLGERISDGLIIVKYGHPAQCRRVRVVEAGHPVPDAAGLHGARQMLRLVDGAGEDTLIICLISGGGSALLVLPAASISLAELQEVTRRLLAAGADIGEINVVRKHISALKGGQLARRAHPATLVNLVLSDVAGDRLDVIASGPAVPDASTFADARQILEHYDLWREIAVSLRARIEQGERGEVPETPKPDDSIFARCTNVIVASNRLALDACEIRARALGYHALVLASTIEGETRDVARVHAAIAREIRSSGRPVQPPACLISGGETTVTLRGRGRGGRNQEFALAAAIDLAGEPGIAVFSAGTDGSDGPTEAAGGVAFGDTVARAAARGMSARVHLQNNDAYPLLDAVGGLVRTGPTGTNVMDIHLVLVSEQHVGRRDG